MKKNIIFLHLESLNHTIFNHRQWFPFTNKIYNQSLRFNNFISSATSSLMALSDLLHGDDNTLEHNTHLEENISIHRHNPALFDVLKQHGYTTAGMGYPKNWANVDAIWSETDTFNWYDTSEKCWQKCSRSFPSRNPLRSICGTSVATFVITMTLKKVALTASNAGSVATKAWILWSDRPLKCCWKPKT